MINARCNAFLRPAFEMERECLFCCDILCAKFSGHIVVMSCSRKVERLCDAGVCISITPLFPKR